MWEDRTINYFTVVRSTVTIQPPFCAQFGFFEGVAGVVGCKGSHSFKRYLCHVSSNFLSPLRHRQITPKVASILSTNITDSTGATNVQIEFKGPKNPANATGNMSEMAPVSRSVVCPGGHLTHEFLACDTQSACWGDEYVIYSLSSDAWAVPTSSSCPAPMSSLPPSFACEWGEQRVPYSVLCDHRADCRDASDEDFCHFPPCHVDRQFQCNNKEVWISVQ